MDEAQSIKNYGPLCRGYLFLHIDAAIVRLSQAGVVREQALHWGLGLLGDGQWETFCMSSQRMPGGYHWRSIYEELFAKGVEAIDFLASNEGGTANVDARGAFAGVKVLPSMHQLLHESLTKLGPRDRTLAARVLGAVGTAVTRSAAQQALAAVAASPWGSRWPALVDRWIDAVVSLNPFYAQPPRHRRMIRWADGAAEQLQRAVTRAIGRHGPFDDRASAVAFLAQALIRAERRLGAAPTRSSSNSYTHRLVPHPGSRL